MKKSNREDTLLLAIGNSGRQDDGLGWAFAEAVEKAGFFKGQIHYRYQLQVEDADLVAQAGEVIFVDACKGELPEGYAWRPCSPAPVFHFSTHALPPESILFLCENLFGKRPESHCLLIQGLQWELSTGLSAPASAHLADALLFFEMKCKSEAAY